MIGKCERGWRSFSFGSEPFPPGFLGVMVHTSTRPHTSTYGLRDAGSPARGTFGRSGQNLKTVFLDDGQ
jgi:hypothetical protein